MKLFKAGAAVLSLAILGALFATVVKASDWDHKTVVTFTAPLEIPGVHLTGYGVLPAGTYVFKIMDSQTNRHIVQIFNEDETVIYATILAIPNYRLTPSDKTVITFSERPAGTPEALRAWFTPGANWGEEFVYPKAKAMELAKTAHVPVLFTPVDMPLEVAEPIKSPDEPVAVQLKQAPVQATNANGDELPLSEEVSPAPNALPATASTSPLFGLFGVLALTAALAAGLIAKRST